MVLSEDILKIKYRKEPFDVFEIEKGTLLTPSAKQFLNEKGIELVIKGEKSFVSTKSEEENVEAEEKIFYEKPKYVGKNGECYFEKPEHMTVVDGNVLISKNSKLIALRGKIETFLAEVLLTGKEIGLTSNNDKLIRDIEIIIKFIQNIMVAEKLDKILENQTFFDSKSIKDIKEIIENPKEYFKKGHILEISLNSDLTIHKSNRLRFLARELEIQAIDYFVEDYKVTRKDLLETFNVLSDVIYIIILKVDNGEYR
ncbi:ethanolamine utilization protein [Fusobacterium hwasookii]|uniref:ethanolamine utilization protein n=1 Tax=Fusobacterium hwasookii TaxID=1583098 RepID=UPI001627CB92|nr:ethanolamine utilization protein [Fusobacterium hwasookii]QNE66245.1 ethanolamine utilization protein [Fusobacterium hwasookii]